VCADLVPIGKVPDTCCYSYWYIYGIGEITSIYTCKREEEKKDCYIVGTGKSNNKNVVVAWRRRNKR
jgi:hypothetical protein